MIATDMHDPYPSRLPGASEKPPVLPRHDPVVHSQWSPDAPLSRAQSDAFDRDGYLMLEGLFSQAETAILQAEAARLLRDPSALDPETIVSEPGGSEVRSIFAIHEQNAVIARLAADARLADIARYLLADDVTIHQSRLNYKPGFDGKEFYWHSDFETWHMEDGMPRMRALSMSILLTENSVLNGPLMVMPGSHRHYVSCIGETPDAHYLQSLKKQEVGVPDRERLEQLAADHGIVAPVGKPGSVILFDCNMMHGSSSNITPFARSNAFIVYNAASNRLVTPFGGTAPRPAFIAARQAQPVQPAHGHLEIAA